MGLSVKRSQLRADLFNPLQILAAQAIIHILSGKGCDHPNCATKKKRISEIYAAVLLAGHGMAGEKPARDTFAKNLARTRHDLRLRAAHVRNERAGRQPMT